MKFTYNKKRYDLDPEQLSVAEAREIKTHAGMTLREWQQGLEDIDPDAIAALVYTAVRRSGGEIAWHDLDEMNLVDLANSIASENEMPEQDGVTPLHSENRQARRARAAPRKPTAKK